MVGKGKRIWEIRAAASEPKVGEVLLYGTFANMSWWGDEVTPKQFREDLKALGDIDELRVFVNSGGGDVFAGQAIHSIIKRHSAATKIGYVDGLAASAASLPLMACDVIRMPRNAMMMVHNPMTWGYGNATELRRMADDLDKIREPMISAYEDKTGLARERISELLDAETWMNAEEAVELGFADEVDEAKQVAASLENGRLVLNGQEFDLSRFRHPPKLLAVAAQLARPGGPNSTDPAQRRNTAPLSLFERRLKQNER